MTRARKVTLPGTDFEERFIRATGPGGQNIRKQATTVELRLDLARSSLPGIVKERVRALAPAAITKDDVLVVRAGAKRSQAENRRAARARLFRLLQRAATPPRPRRLTRPPIDARERRLTEKHIRGAVKQSRSHASEVAR